MNTLSILWLIVYALNLILPALTELNVLSLILWLVTVIVFFKRHTQFSFLNFMVLFAYTTTGLSCLVAEFGSYYAETRWVSALTGATVRNLSLCFFLMYSSLLGFNFIRKYLPENYPTLKVVNMAVSRLIILATCMIVVTLFYLNYKYGSPNDYNVDRFYYWSHIAPSWGDYLKFNLVQASFILGMIYARRTSHAILCLFVLGVISQVMVGEKFTGIFSSLIFFITPYFVVHYYNFNLFSFENISFALLAIAILSVVIYESYVAIVGERNAADSFISRIILQSQMWWTVDYISTGMKTFSEISSSFLGRTQDDSLKGIFYLMSKVTPPEVFQGFYDKKINFTMASPVNFIYFFGYPFSIIVVLFIGFYCGLLYGIFRSAILSYDYWIVLGLIKVHYSIVRILTMGEMYAFREPKFILLCSIAFLYALFICFICKRGRINEI